MPTILPWGTLVENGRAKAHGVPWSDQEIKARYELGIPAEYVRKGVLTLEEYQAELGEADKTDVKSLRQMSKEELKNLATDLGIEVPKEVKRLEVISLIKQSRLSDKQSASEEPRL